MRDKAISFFFTNFPDNWDSGALWKMFSRYGNVVDVYIAFKKPKGILDSVFAKFIKGESKGIMSSDFPPIRPGLFTKPVAVNTKKGSSFKDAVTGGKRTGWSIRTNYIHVDEDKNIKSKLERSWIGKAKNFHVLQNA
ncbi:nucleotide-binding alpha-beta plait domain-containing protein [Tanacetum coccineum]